MVEADCKNRPHLTILRSLELRRYGDALNDICPATLVSI